MASDLDDRFTHLVDKINNPRNVLRGKFLKMLAYLGVDGLQRSVAVSQFEGWLKNASALDVEAVLRILRE